MNRKKVRHHSSLLQSTLESIRELSAVKCMQKRCGKVSQHSERRVKDVKLLETCIYTIVNISKITQYFGFVATRVKYTVAVMEPFIQYAVRTSRCICLKNMPQHINGKAMLPCFCSLPVNPLSCLLVPSRTNQS